MRRVVGSSKVFNKQKASSTVWYTNNEDNIDPDEVTSEVTSSKGFTLPHAATAHTALNHMDREQVNNATTSAFRYSPHHLLSSRAKWLLGMQGNDLNQVKGRMDEAKLEALKAECLRKINKVQKLIEQEQTSMQEKLAEFLFISKEADSSQTTRVKAVYEKKAKKSNANIKALQQKLGTYKAKLERLEMIQEEQNKRFRNRCGSLDNISSILELPKEPLAKKTCVTLPRNSRYRSAEFLPPKSKAKSPANDGQQDQTFRFSIASEEDPLAGIELSMNEFNSLVSDIEESFKKHKELEDLLEEMKGQINQKRNEWRSLLEESRYHGDHLEEQINDMMELHQQEVVNMKQELASLEEKLEYQMDERMRDLQDVVDACQTKITKLELQQQQSVSVETLEGFSVKGCATKAANALLTMFAFCLIVVSVVISFTKTCLQSKVLCSAACTLLVTSVFLWHSSRFMTYRAIPSVANDTR